LRGAAPQKGSAETPDSAAGEGFPHQTFSPLASAFSNIAGSAVFLLSERLQRDFVGGCDEFLEEVRAICILKPAI
jgi:hypothetical protein